MRLPFREGEQGLVGRIDQTHTFPTEFLNEETYFMNPKGRILTPACAPKILYWSSAMANFLIGNNQGNIFWKLTDWNNNLGFEYDTYKSAITVKVNSEIFDIGESISLKKNEISDSKLLSTLLFLVYSFDWSADVYGDEGLWMKLNDGFTWFYLFDETPLVEFFHMMDRDFSLDFDLF
ncbi:MAG: hypothetical protein MI807_08790 [Verrucomicrobiales bacterium]|nr:hypothetical protein [Verrucomicrobiales bacterium]